MHYNNFYKCTYYVFVYDKIYKKKHVKPVNISYPFMTVQSKIVICPTSKPLNRHITRQYNVGIYVYTYICI